MVMWMRRMRAEYVFVEGTNLMAKMESGNVIPMAYLLKVVLHV